MNLKLIIELVPSTSWYKNLRRKITTSNWDKIRKKAYADANFQCQICGTKGKLSCHEDWSYDDKNLVQKLNGFMALCGDCHNIKHAGFSMHTAEGKRLFNRDKLINHFCKVNECTKEDFYEHENIALEIFKKRSKYQWKIDLGKYSKLVKKES